MNVTVTTRPHRAPHFRDEGTEAWKLPGFKSNLIRVRDDDLVIAHGEYRESLHSPPVTGTLTFWYEYTGRIHEIPGEFVPDELA